MTDFLKSKDWLTIEAASRQLTSFFQKEVTKEDIFQEAHDGRINLSVFLRGYWAKKERSYSPLPTNDYYHQRAKIALGIYGHKGGHSEKEVEAINRQAKDFFDAHKSTATISEEIIFLKGIYQFCVNDMPDHILALALGNSPEEYIDGGWRVYDNEGMAYRIYEYPSEVNNLRRNDGSLVRSIPIPSINLPDTSNFIIQRCHLEDFEKSNVGKQKPTREHSTSIKLAQSLKPEDLLKHPPTVLTEAYERFYKAVKSFIKQNERMPSSNDLWGSELRHHYGSRSSFMKTYRRYVRGSK